MPRKPKHTTAVNGDGGAAQHGARPLWSGTLSFGLVTVPVDLFPALQTVRSPLRMISSDGHMLARQYVNDRGKLVEPSAVQRGYPISKDKFVVLRDEELEGLAPEKSQDLNVVRFVEAKSISPMYFEHPYILAPRGAQKAYRLLAATMEELDRVALASFVMRGSEYVLAVRAEGGVLRADVIRFAGELRSSELVPGLEQARKPAAAKVHAMKKAVEALKRKPFVAAEAGDAYWERVSKLAKQKARRHQDVVEPEPAQVESEPMADVIDLMDVLKRSLHAGKTKR